MKIYILLALMCSLSLFANPPKDLNLEELKLKKIQKTERNAAFGEKIPYKSKSVASRLSNIEVKSVTNTSREQNLKRYIELNKLESDDQSQLSLSVNYLEPKLKDPNKYKIKSVNYHFGDGSIQSTSLSQFDGADHIILDISNLSVGKYTALIELVIQKNEDKRAKGNKKNKSFKPIFLTYSVDFEKVKSSFLVINEYFRAPGVYAVGLDLSESYSDGGEILNYRVQTFFNGEPEIDATITFNRFSLSFYKAGEWTVRITMTDSLGDTDTKEINYTVTNARPSLSFEYQVRDNGQIDIDLSKSTDDGTIVQYATFFRIDGAIIDYYTHEPITIRSLKQSGSNILCARILDDKGADAVSCRNIFFEGDIAPSYTLFRLEQQVFDPRFYFPIQNCDIANNKQLNKIVFKLTKEGSSFEQEVFDVNALVFVPEPGIWEVEAYCEDSNNLQSNKYHITLNAEFDLGKPEAYVEIAELESSTNGLDYFASVEESIPSPYANFVGRFNYSGRNIDNGDTFKYSFEFPFPNFEFPSYGTWEISYTVIDDFGIESDPFVFIQKVVNPLPIARITIAKNKDDQSGLNYIVTSETSDPGNSNITSYNFNFTNTETGRSFSLSPSQPFISFTFDSVGSWQLEYTVTNEQGYVSEPYILNINVINEKPTPSFDVVAIDRFTYEITSNSTDDTSVIGSIVKLNGNEEFYNADVFTIAFSNPGMYYLDLFAVDNLNQKSAPIRVTIKISDRELDGDGIPPIPDAEANKSTIGGVDTDLDGVRDDVELIINDLGVSRLDRENLKLIASSIQKLLLETDEFKINELQKRLLFQTHCYSRKKLSSLDDSSFTEQSKVFKDNFNLVLSNIYNTEDRIRKELFLRTLSSEIDLSSIQNINCE